MECTCPYCGKKTSSEKLTFDFTEKFKEKLEHEFGDVKLSFDTLFNKWEKGEASPTFLSESELERCTTDIQQVAAGTRKGFLSVPSELWKNKLEAFRAGAEQLDYASRKVIDRMKESAASSPYILEMKVHFIKDGKGAIKISSITDENHSFIARDRHCPNCGKAMSYWAGRYPELLLTVLGGPRISKSTALAACAHMFTTNLNNCNITWTGHTSAEGQINEKGDKNWNAFCRQCLAQYEKNEKVVATRPNNDNSESIPRFSVLVTIKKEKKSEHLVLTVVDFPGEYMEDEDSIGIADEARKQYAELYRNVDCIWYCTDGAEALQLNIRGSQEDMDIYGYDKGKRIFSTGTLVSGMSSFAGMFQKNVPVVFLLGKSDAIKEERNAIKEELYQTDYQPGDDWISLKEGYPALLGKQQYMRARRLCNYLENRNERLIQGFRENFPVHTFIATSNYGHGFKKDATAGGGQHSLYPYQTEAPFLWTLAVNGFLPVMEDDGQIYQAGNPKGKKHISDATMENLGMCGGSTEGYQTRKRKRNRQKPKVRPKEKRQSKTTDRLAHITQKLLGFFS